MSISIPCNDYLHTSRANKNRICFRFVTADGNTPSVCTVRIGDTDPLTGETITCVELFKEYYRLVDHQIYSNRKQTKNRLSLDGMIDEKGKNEMDKITENCIPAIDPFGTDEPEEITLLKEYASTLTGRQADIYEALLIKYAGGKEKISMTDLAHKWGVSVTQICKDRDKIIETIKEKIRQP